MTYVSNFSRKPKPRRSRYLLNDQLLQGGSALAYQNGLPALFDSGHPVAPPLTKERRLQLTLKRALDIIAAPLAILMLSPLLIAIAAAIRLTSRGPVFFYQTRPGLGGRPFRMIKFRTMYVERGDLSGIQQTTVGDDRVTAIGRFLRQASLDELPQLFNVVAGEMSLVGPRPHVEGMQAAGRDYRELVPHYEYRYWMRPGVTGWAQANGLRGPTGDAGRARARIDHDVAYIQNFSVLLDLKIMWLTVRREFLSGSGV